MTALSNCVARPNFELALSLINTETVRQSLVTSMGWKGGLLRWATKQNGTRVCQIPIHLGGLPAPGASSVDLVIVMRVIEAGSDGPDRSEARQICCGCQAPFIAIALRSRNDRVLSPDTYNR